MDRVLIDCLILSFVAMMILGNSAYFFGPKLLTIYTSNSKVIQCGMEILLYTTVTYFLCGFMDLFPGALRGMGRSGVPMILSIIGTVGTRIVWIFWIFPNHRSLDILFISYSSILDHNNRITGDLLLLCEKTIICKNESRSIITNRQYINQNWKNVLPFFVGILHIGILFFLFMNMNLRNCYIIIENRMFFFFFLFYFINMFSISSKSFVWISGIATFFAFHFIF